MPNYFISSLNQTLSVGGNDTSIQLSTIYTQDGQVVTTSDFAAYGRGIITVNPLTVASCEFISFTGITANTAPLGTLTGCLRGLSFKGNNQIAANQKFNVVGTPVIISFGTHNLLDIPTLAGTQTFTGQITFSLPPIGINPGGSPNASSTVAGITKLDVNPVSSSSPIAVGSNSPLLTTLSGTASGVSNQLIDVDSLATTSTNNAVVRANSSGKIDNSFLQTGTSANNIVQLNGSSQLPAVDGSLLTNLSYSKAIYGDVPSSPVTVASTTTTVYTSTITANTFAVGTVLRGTIFALLQNGNPGTSTINLTYGGTTIATYTNSTINISPAVVLQYEIHIISATTANIYYQNVGFSSFQAATLTNAVTIPTIASNQTLAIAITTSNGTASYYSSEMQKVK